jgi:hypothetical protein
MARTTFGIFFAQYDKEIGYTILALLIFLLGWQTGRVMSPYYASSPIVFEDRQCSACAATASSGGSVEELTSLQNAPGASEASKTSQTSPSSSQGLYVASKNSTLFHHYTCSSAKSIKAENQVWYATYEEAAASGRSPSSCTQKLPK